MGRDWYWSRSFRRGEKESAGCMSGVLQFFDFHQLQYSTQQQQQLQPHVCKTTDSLQGVEAPRNSLESEVDAAPSSSAVVIEDDIPIGIQLHPGVPKPMEKDSSSETSSSQGSKTPNLVARLMGLDLLPDQVSSPPMHKRNCSSPVKCHQSSRPAQRRDRILAVNETTGYESGIRSLPDTPRISSARRSDVDPRFSLQLNKENIDVPEFNYFSSNISRNVFSASSPFSLRKIRTKEGRFHDENKSPNAYAREIVEQVKESVSRRVGMDITNISCRSRSCDESISSQTFSVKKTKLISKTSEESNPSKPSTPSCSPRLRFLEPKTKRVENKDPISISNYSKPSSPKSHSSPLPLSSTSMSFPPRTSKESAKPKSKPLPKSTAKCKKASCERFTQRPKKPSPTSQTARERCKTPISNTRLVQIHPSSNSNAIQNPTQTVVSPPLPSTSSQQQYERQLQKPKPPRYDREDSIRTTVTDSEELRYVKGILERTGIDRNATVSFTRWFSPAHPVAPSVFHHLEHSFPATDDGPLQHRCNRQLLFNAIDEILHNALKPHLCMRPWLERWNPVVALSRRQTTGDELLQQLSAQLSRFPSAKCETLQDIDGLVGFDLSHANVRIGASYSALDEECESLVFEMERKILESLIQEALLLMV